MTERGSLDPTRGTARSSTDSPIAELAAPMQALVTAAVPSRDRSLPAALCTIAGEVGFGADARRASSDAGDSADANEPGGTDAVLEPVVTAVTYLEGYVRLRLSLVAGTGEPSAHGLETIAWPAATRPTDLRDCGDGDTAASIDRDAAILASDYLHAGAYATLAETPVSDRRRLECVRLLTEGSTTLARQFLSTSRTVDGGSIDAAHATDDGPADADAAADQFGAAATLGGTAASIGAAAAGAPTETRTALRTYSHALMTALASQSAAVADDIDPRASAVRVLTGETARAVAADDRERASTTTVERCLERARGALEALAGADDRNEPVAFDDPDGAESTPLARLERATRVPFRRE